VSDYMLSALPFAMTGGTQKLSSNQPVGEVSAEFSERFMVPLTAALKTLDEALPVAATGPDGRPLPVTGKASPATAGDASEDPAVLAMFAVGSAPVEARAAIRSGTLATPASDTGAVRAAVRMPADSRLEAAPGAQEPALLETLEGTSERREGRAELANDTRFGATFEIEGRPERRIELLMPERPAVVRAEAAAKIEAAFGLDAAEGVHGMPTDAEGQGSQTLLVTPARGESIEVRQPAIQLAGPAMRLEGGQWQEQFVQRMSLAVADGLKEARIIIDPPELGPLDLKVGMSGGETQVQFTAYHAHTRDLIEEAMPRLKEMFEQAGLKLGDADVRQGDRDAGGMAREFADGNRGGDTGGAEVDGVVPGMIHVRESVSLLDVYD